MFKAHKALHHALIAATLMGLLGFAIAQEPYLEVVPTKKEPLRFSAVGVQLERSMMGVFDITVERWTTEDERKALVALLGQTTWKDTDQKKLVKALQDIKPRTGFLRAPNSIGLDLKYAYQSKTEDGSRQIVFVTDRPIGFASAASGQQYEAAFTLIELRFPPGSMKGEGKFLAQAGISVKDGKLQIDAYVNHPAQLTDVLQKNPKAKK